MKTKKYCIMYLKKARWTYVENGDKSTMLFESVDAAKKHIDDYKSENKDPECVCHKCSIFSFCHSCVIFEYENSSIKGSGIRYRQ